MAPMTAYAADVSTTPAELATVEQAVRDSLASGKNPAVLVKFKGKADLSRAFTIADRDERSIYVYNTLKNFADRAQAQVRQTLARQYGLSEQAHEYTVLWVDNSIAISHLNSSLLSSLAGSPEIESIRTQREISLPVDEVTQSGPELDAVVSSLTRIKVPDVWALGYKGSGIVLANIDAGVRHTHAALVNQYRGNIGGGNFDHQFNWYDPYNHAAVPRYTDPHGSHTMGTMLGDNGGTEQIGVAPAAKWVNCIGFGRPGAGATDAGLLECGQWMIAPTDIAGTPGSADPTKRPDVVNNSWGDCGRTFDNWYDGVIDGWIAAGIAPVFSNGNASNCGYPNNPPLNTVGNPARSGKVLGIGSTGTTNGQYAPHSNKGPTDNPNPGTATYPDAHGFANLKPNFAAPGVNIRSAMSSSDTAYGGMTGTSMSAPAVTGVIGLMWDAASCLKGDYARTGTILMETATRIPVATGSPADGPGNIPNQATGWGEVDALAAVNAALAFCGAGGTDPVANISPGTLSFNATAGASDSKPLTIANVGGGSLTYTVTESAAARPAGSYLTSQAAFNKSGGTITGSLSVSPNRANTALGQPYTLMATDISQMADNSPGDEGVSCGQTGVSTSDNSWWRRFYFNEHPQVGATANVESVTISTGSIAAPGGLPSTINLYTIPHSTAVDTIPTGSLTLIGTASASVNGALTSVTIPVIGEVTDTAGLDLVVEWHTDGNPSGQFFPGANATPETHPTFLSATGCGITTPTKAADIGFPDFHLTMVVTLGDGGGGTPGCDNPTNIPWLSATPTSGSLGAGASDDVAVTVDASTLTAGTYTANLCVATNDPTHALIPVPVSVTVESVGPTDGIFCDGFEGGDGSCAPVGPPPTGDIVHSGPINVEIPQTIDGLYINFVTGQTSPSEIPGYDFDPYMGNGTLLFYWAGDIGASNGGVAATENGPYLVLDSGAVIGPSSTFSAAANGSNNETAAFIAGVDGYLGVKFLNEETGETNYGYVRIKTTAPGGFPATIVEYAYDKSGAAITIP